MRSRKAKRSTGCDLQQGIRRLQDVGNAADGAAAGLPYVVTLFVHVPRRERHVKELAEILETDSGLTIELMRYVNSSSWGLRNKAKTVLQALTLLGCSKSRMFVIATGMEAAIRARFCKLLDQTAFWSDNLQKAIFLALKLPCFCGRTPTSHSSAPLQDYLLPILTNDLADDYRDFLQSRENPTATLSEFEQTRFGWDHGLAVPAWRTIGICPGSSCAASFTTTEACRS